jgi:hypothetical protein
MIRLVARSRPIAQPTTSPAPRPTLTARELSLCVELLGKGRTVQQAIDRIQAERPTLPFTPPEAA